MIISSSVVAKIQINLPWFTLSWFFSHMQQVQVSVRLQIDRHTRAQWFCMGESVPLSLWRLIGFNFVYVSVLCHLCEYSLGWGQWQACFVKRGTKRQNISHQKISLSKAHTHSLLPACICPHRDRKRGWLAQSLVFLIFVSLLYTHILKDKLKLK